MAVQRILAMLVGVSIIAATVGANAQSTTSGNNNSGIGGTAASGTGVKTGKGPLTQPVPPAVNLSGPRQDPQRPANVQGPAQTNPPKQPFGSQQN